MPIGELTGKRLQLLKEAVPGVSRVAVFGHTTIAPGTVEFADAQRAAAALSVQLIPLDLPASNPDFEGAFETASAERADALLAFDAAVIGVNRAQVTALATRYHLPSMFYLPVFAAGGGLMAYGPNAESMSRRAAYYVDRILKGAKPADLPVEQPMLFDFVVNLKTARELGITFPREILLQVTEVFE
jgi:putative ABC transport system substrate-binding protein